MIPTLYKSALHPREVRALLKLTLKGQQFTIPKEPLAQLVSKLDDQAFCCAALTKVSRSFAAVIQQLPEDLKNAVCVFYLVLRALDTIEDDMQFPQEEKLKLLRSFHIHTQDENFTLQNVGDHEDYRILLEHYDKVVRFFKSLDDHYREVIVEITKKMGNGMADFAEKKVVTVKDYDLYCHYVAGLVGVGLSDLFSASGLESPDLKERHDLSNSMGLFLQKTNIIRDYHEDLFSDRTFWPEEIWGKYADDLSYFTKNPHDPKSLACLNEMVMNALTHLPDVVDYLRLLKNKSVFRFAAIPQVMAIATLAVVFNNPKTFTGVVKVRKGLAARLILYDLSLEETLKYFKKYSRVFLRKTPKNTDLHKQLSEWAATLNRKIEMPEK
ncbi:squalene synthase [Candidatus Sulfidibacterium hydrothermale]|uniref:squalene synthase n=1 Tax=Candidatus Sulfidibacterium hydrothermale TaxID=2875962 RepID=UPI001F0AB4E5|nr:squalene synthase [Candidatus Sulfidibacterium hydrothermale]UBM63016.1 squalene synthase [Candidatus Sulfidibacterium hydrothermale]